MEDRITNLEIKFAHQDEFIMELNRIVVDQQKRIEQLERELLEQRGIVVGMNGGNEALLMKNSKPPHY